MNAELKAQWIAALRSGQYRQGRGVLCSQTDQGYQYCCLGVLGVVCGMPNGRLQDRVKLDDVGLAHALDAWNARQYIPGQGSASFQNRLAVLNDAGLPFESIAEWIEANVPAAVIE